MIQINTRVCMFLTALILCAMLVVPATALASQTPGPEAQQQVGYTSGTGCTEDGQQYQVMVRACVEAALQARSQRFETAREQIQENQQRVLELANRVGTLGGDVSQICEQIRLSEQLLTQACVQERDALRAFEAVPDSGSMRADLIRARRQARNAVETMNASRVQLRQAATLLRQIAAGLELESSVQ